MKKNPTLTGSPNPKKLSCPTSISTIMPTNNSSFQAKKHVKLKKTHANLQREKRRVKCKWQSYLTEKCQCDQFKVDLKAAWDIVFKIMEGFTAHHRKFNLKCFANNKGKIT